MDTLVFDIETQNFFTNPEVGWHNYGALKISLVGVYSYTQDKYFTFEEDEMEGVAKLFRTAARLVGFSMNRYDVPVLNLYFQKVKDQIGLDLWKKDRVDLLDEIEMATGERVSLEKLAQANLGIGKIGHGAEAITLYNEGRMEELKAYCLQDVKLTKELYDIYKTKGELLVPNKTTGELVPVRLRTVEPAQATLL